MTGFVTYETPQEVIDKVYEAVTLAKSSGKLSKGVNEATKAIERGTAKLVILAQDTSPPEILMHLPLLCGEKHALYTYVPSKEDLGKAAGINVPTTAVVITEDGEAKQLISEITRAVTDLIPKIGERSESPQPPEEPTQPEKPAKKEK